MPERLNPFRILLVEDNHLIRELLADLLAEEGYQVTPADDGSTAQGILAESAAFDLLITDFRMPQVNGDELLQWCREKRLHFPVIFTTAEKNLLPREKISLGDCCAELLPKPFQIYELLTAIDSTKARVHQVDCVTALKKTASA
jgi:CheY-like chemotaxis protein